MQTIRKGVFETNSSSTHSLVIMSEEEYRLAKTGEVLIHEWYEKCYTRQEAIKKMREEYTALWKDDDTVDTNISDEELINRFRYDFKTLDEYFDTEDLETFVGTYTTEGGEEIRVVGKYGYNG